MDMKKIFVFIVIIVSVGGLISTLHAQDHKKAVQKYIEILPDIPLMDGLEECPETQMIFDKPDGRIAEISFYSDSLSIVDIDIFYAQTLPQLGWVIEIPHSYTREQERLTIQVEKVYQDVLVHFVLSPNKDTRHPIEKK